MDFSAVGIIILVLAVFAAGRALFRRGRAPEGPAFRKVPVLNRSETRLHSILARNLEPLFGGGSQLLAQVSLGEFLRSDDRGAFLSINSKRADFVVVDRDFNPVATIEYQGKGHYGWTREAAADARRRDGIKRMALTSAGIPMIEIPADYNERSVLASVRAALPYGPA
ncbi:DUF2726 domain-containing protein [Defluviimonas salinarum]|uniref:DUF2726 domain-containing protein n=1 Tax=Defluviimonas salinarum TaxID=2992147 RepID=A0ABT3J882_9RHOB|nr:DUF2726 domain-containing protein [Defluviimonas salinarum]MCW3783884.1 DUF2726 domain-containing protein [Defluviimonas salinarum]